MFGVISSNLYGNKIKGAIKGSIVFEEINKSVDIGGAFEKLKHVNLKYLVLDLSLVSDVEKPFVIELLKDYRVTRPNVVVYLVGVGYVNTDSFLNLIVNLGIYNILIVDNAELIPSVLGGAIKEPKTFAYACRFQQSGNVEKNKQEKEDAKSIVTTIREERLIGSVSIGVAGVSSHVGVTHLTMAMAFFLQRKGFKVAVLNLHESDDFLHFSDAYDDVRSFNDGFIYKNVFFYTSVDNYNLINILKQDYDYFIYDSGIYNDDSFGEYHRANVRMVLLSCREWELPIFENMFGKLDKDDKQDLHYLINYADDSMFSFVKKSMSGFKVHKVIYEPNLSSALWDKFFTDLLVSVLPSNNQISQRSILGTFLKRGVKNG